MVFVDFQQSTFPMPCIKWWTDALAMTGRARRRVRIALHHMRCNTWPDTQVLVVTQHQVGYRELLECQTHDLTRPISTDQTHHHVRSVHCSSSKCFPLTSPYVRHDRTHTFASQVTNTLRVRSQAESAPHCAEMTGRACLESGPAFGHPSDLLNFTNIVTTSSPLLKCANHQVYHLVHVC
jgi:hypothetical protein